jgi:Flp pilus assembly protein TadD
MENCRHLPVMKRLARSRIVAASASVALLLSASAPTMQDDEARPVVQSKNDQGSLMRVADMTWKAGDRDTAIALYNRAHEMNPQDPRPLIALARALDEVGAHSDAVARWQEAVRLAPSDADALGGYGVALARFGQPELARNYLKKAVAAAPTTDTYNALGVVHDQLGDAAAAQAAYRAGLEKTPTDARLASNLGLSLALSGRVKEGIEILERVVVRPDANVRHRQNLALAYALAGQDEMSARFGRIDFETGEAERNVMRYSSLAALPDHATRVSAVGALRQTQVAANRPAASVESAALVNARDAQPEPKADKQRQAGAEAPVTPMLNATRVAPAEPEVTKATPLPRPRANDAPMALAAASAGDKAPRKPLAMPPKQPVVSESTKKPAAPARVREAAPQPPVPAETRTAPAAPGKTNEKPATQVAAVPAVRADAAPADDAAAALGKPQVYRPEFRPAEPAKPAVASAAPVAAGKAEAAGGSSAPSGPVAAAPAKPASAVMQPAVPKRQTAAAPEAKDYPLSLAGIEIPSIEDRMVVAASAYHAGEFAFAAEIWQPLADAGVAQAMFHLGALYYEGKGVERDLGKAYMNLRQAELAGFADARIVLVLVETKLTEADRKRVEQQLAAAAR